MQSTDFWTAPRKKQRLEHILFAGNHLHCPRLHHSVRQLLRTSIDHASLNISHFFYINQANTKLVTCVTANKHLQFLADDSVLCLSVEGLAHQQRQVPRVPPNIFVLPGRKKSSVCSEPELIRIALKHTKKGHAEKVTNRTCTKQASIQLAGGVAVTTVTESTSKRECQGRRYW